MKYPEDADHPARLRRVRLPGTIRRLAGKPELTAGRRLVAGLGSGRPADDSAHAHAPSGDLGGLQVARAQQGQAVRPQGAEL